MSTNIAKVSLQGFDSHEEVLYRLDKTKSLSEILVDVCEKLQRDPQAVECYGLKIMPTNTSNVCCYITESNLQEVQHNNRIKLVLSISSLVENIFKMIHKEAHGEACLLISELCADPGFIDELVRVGKVEDLLKTYVSNYFEGDNNKGYLITILHLLQKGFITKTEPNYLPKIITTVKSKTTAKNEREYALSIAQRILSHRNPVFNSWKYKIINSIQIVELFEIISDGDSDEDLQYGALYMMNTIIRSCKSSDRMQLIKAIDKRSHRESIFNHIILKRNIAKRLQHELYVIQTLLFR